MCTPKHKWTDHFPVHTDTVDSPLQSNIMDSPLQYNTVDTMHTAERCLLPMSNDFKTIEYLCDL